MDRDTLMIRSPQRFRAAMSAAALDGRRIADAAGVSKQFVSLMLCRNRRCNPTIADRIARELSLPTEALFTSDHLSEESDNDMEREMSINADDPILRFDDVAALTGIKPKTLRHLRAKRQGPPFYKVGQNLYIRKSKADAWRKAFEDAAAAE